jgi:hypothetical protein
MMPSFRTYLEESFISERVSNNAELIFQKIVDRIDNGHIDIEDDCVEFHIGRLIKNSRVDLCMHIRCADSNNVRLGKKGDQCYVVIDTTKKLPERTTIDTFLTKDSDLANKVRECIDEFISDHMDHDNDPDVKTQGEDEHETNTSTHFEERYQLMMERLKDKIENYHRMVEKMKEEMHTENKSKKAVLSRAMSLLAEEEFGEDVEGFKKIARGLMSQDDSGVNRGFANNLSPENKKRLDSRLESLYDQKIKPLLKK